MADFRKRKHEPMYHFETISTSRRKPAVHHL